jgi:farnesyl diphosphate synthase
MASAQIFGVEPLQCLNAAVAMEFVHSYSLIHDDLPAMDDDDFRRGKPSLHKKFNEATAILAGDALLTFAFEILTETQTSSSAKVRCELIKTLAKAAGFKGMAGGQMIDLEKSNQQISKEELNKLHRLKTGELFMAAAEIGAIIGKASVEERRSLGNFAHDLGLAFQIKDDILDYRVTFKSNAKTNEIILKKAKESTNIVDVIGLEPAKKQLNLLKHKAIENLKIFDAKADLLRDLCSLVVDRQI